MPGPRTIYRWNGIDWLYVRTEDREQIGTNTKRAEHLFVGTDNGLILNRWHDALPDEAVPVNDTEGRLEAQAAWLITQAIEKERDVLKRTMEAAIAMLNDREAEELRQMYIEGMKDVEVISQ